IHGLLVIPGSSLLVGGGKTGMLSLVDGRSMKMLQSLQAFTNTYHPDWNYGCPAAWVNPSCCRSDPNCSADCAAPTGRVDLICMDHQPIGMVICITGERRIISKNSRWILPPSDFIHHLLMSEL